MVESWNSVAAGEKTALEQRARYLLASVYAADSAREAMDLIYQNGGSTSFRRRAAWPSTGATCTPSARRSRSAPE
jgi:hypothetical protein